MKLPRKYRKYWKHRFDNTYIINEASCESNWLRYFMLKPNFRCLFVVLLGCSI